MRPVDSCAQETLDEISRWELRLNWQYAHVYDDCWAWVLEFKRMNPFADGRATDHCRLNPRLRGVSPFIQVSY